MPGSAQINYRQIAESASQYKLSMLFGIDSFFYAITERNAEVIFKEEVAMPDSEDKLTEFISDSPLLQLPFKAKLISIRSRNFNLIPAALFKAEHSKQYLSLTSNLEERSGIAFDKLDRLNMVNVYSIPTNVFRVLQRYFPAHSTHHNLSSLIYQSYFSAFHINNEIVFARIYDDQIDILVFQNEKLLFANVFPINSASDALYYSLSVYNDLDLNPEWIPFRICGKGKFYKEAFNMLDKYLRDLKYLNFNNAHSFNENDNVTEQVLYDLFKVMTCE